MSTSDYQFIIENESDSVVLLKVSGDLTIENSSSIHKQFLKQGISSSEISIFIRDVRNVDLSFIQLLLGFIKYRNKANKLTFVEFDFDDPTLELLKKTGCIETINSLQSKN